MTRKIIWAYYEVINGQSVVVEVYESSPGDRAHSVHYSQTKGKPCLNVDPVFNEVKNKYKHKVWPVDDVATDKEALSRDG